MIPKLRQLFPLPDEPAARRIAGLVRLTCAAIAIGVLALILVWLLTGDLQIESVAAGAVLLAVLGGLAWLATHGREHAALWILTALLFVLIAADAAEYGLHSSMAAAFLIPILLVAGGFGSRAGFGAALVCSAYGWILAAAETGGWFPLPYVADISHLTFDAPALTVIFLLCAAIAGFSIADRPHDLGGQA